MPLGIVGVGIVGVLGPRPVPMMCRVLMMLRELVMLVLQELPGERSMRVGNGWSRRVRERACGQGGVREKEERRREEGTREEGTGEEGTSKEGTREEGTGEEEMRWTCR